MGGHAGPEQFGRNDQRSALAETGRGRAPFSGAAAKSTRAAIRAGDRLCRALATFADMSHLLPAEDWPASEPKSIAYFCGPMVLPPPRPGGEDPVAEAQAHGVAEGQYPWPLVGRARERKPE